jgi:hypothetical protein
MVYLPGFRRKSTPSEMANAPSMRKLPSGTKGVFFLMGKGGKKYDKTF